MGQLLNDTANFTEVAGHLDASSSVRIFTRFDDPDICIFLLLVLLVGSCEPDVFAVCVDRSLHVEGQRNGNLKRVDSHRTIISAHVEEQGLFVRKMIIIFQSIVYQSWQTR